MRPGLHLFEQAHILDGDARLIGKRGAELNLALAERSWRRAYQHEDANDTPFSQQRDPHAGADAQEPGGVVELRIGQYVRDVDGASFQDSAPKQRGTIGPWVVAVEVVDLFLHEPECSNDGINLPVTP